MKKTIEIFQPAGFRPSNFLLNSVRGECDLMGWPKRGGQKIISKSLFNFGWKVGDFQECAFRVGSSRPRGRRVLRTGQIGEGGGMARAALCVESIRNAAVP